jgi:hypothetical protein
MYVQKEKNSGILHTMASETVKSFAIIKSMKKEITNSKDQQVIFSQHLPNSKSINICDYQDYSS